MANRDDSVLRRGNVQTQRPDRSIAQAPAVGTTQGDAQNKTEIYTYFTDPDGQTKLFYNGDRIWAHVTLTLETAGPVAIGNKQNITPVLSGKGELLETGQAKRLVIGRSNRLYIASTSINRVKVEIEPVPWLEQITGTLANLAAGVGAAVQRLLGGK